MNDDEINRLTHKIIGCAMEVHNHLGNGYQEIIYQRALAIEFALQNISFERELEMGLYYKGKSIGTRRVDFFVEEKVMVEIKARESIEKCSQHAGHKLLRSIQYSRRSINQLWSREITIQSGF